VKIQPANATTPDALKTIEDEVELGEIQKGNIANPTE
jgi:hypothetical protein